MANEALLKCNHCGEMKPFALMRKRTKNCVPVQCSACSNKARLARKEKARQLILSQPEEEVIETVPHRTFQFTPYVPEKTWVRNNGNKHIQSRGYQC